MARSVNRQSPDPRHHALMIELDRMYRAYNDDLPLPNAGKVAKRLSLFLRMNPSWPLERLKRAIWNRYYSTDVNRAEDPSLWLGKLANYAGDPLDQYHRPMKGRGEVAARFWLENPQEPIRTDGKRWDEI